MTENMLQKIETDKRHRAEMEKQKREAETEQMESKVKEAEKEYATWQKRVPKKIN
jgi:hypothetical protein